AGPMAFDAHADAAGPFGRWIMLKAPGAETLVHLDADAAPASEGPWPKPALVLVAPDLDAAHERLKAAGAEATAPPGPAEWDPGATRMTFKDSEGDLILATSPLA
ncbi:MAG: VOC family protein, partial [Pseudomonadota bacterium]